MTSIAIVLAVVAAVAIVLIAYALSSAVGGVCVAARLDRYASTGKQTDKKKADANVSIADLLSQSDAMTTVNRAFEQRSFGANIAREIARADMKLKVSEYLLIVAGCTVGVPVLVAAASLLLPALGNPIFLLVGALVGFLAPRFYVSRRKKGRLSSFNKQLPDTITLIANALRAGSSFLQAIELVVREARPPISLEFSRVIREVNLGLPFEQAMENMVRRVRSDDLELMATAITIQHQVGGNLAEILDSIAYTIRERIRIKGEIRTLTAQGRISGYVVAGLPIGILAILTIISPQFLDPMFSKPPEVLGLPAGVIILAVGGFMMLVGFLAIRRIVNIEV